MAGRSGRKDGVLPLAYVPAIHVFLSSKGETWMPGVKPGMTSGRGTARPC
jgi:hypothetical protein